MRCLRILSLAGLVAVAACVPRSEPPPPPQTQPRPAPPPVAPPPATADWSLLPLTPGAWVYSSQNGASQALFGPANSEALFVVRCDRAARQIVLSRAGEASGNTLAIRTSFGARAFTGSVQREPLPFVSATLPADDRFLDSMAFSRGRFTVEMAGAPMLVIPAWPEPARVIEDCRG